MDLREDEYAELFKASHKVSRSLQKYSNANRIVLMVEGYSVGHIHVHLIPTNSGEDFWKARNKNADAVELAKIGQELRNL